MRSSRDAANRPSAWSGRNGSRRTSRPDNVTGSVKDATLVITQRPQLAAFEDAVEGLAEQQAAQRAMAQRAHVGPPDLAHVVSRRSRREVLRCGGEGGFVLVFGGHGGGTKQPAEATRNQEVGRPLAASC